MYWNIQHVLVLQPLQMHHLCPRFVQLGLQLSVVLQRLLQLPVEVITFLLCIGDALAEQLTVLGEP